MTKTKDEVIQNEISKPNPVAEGAGAPLSQSQLKVDTSSLKSSYCNVVSGTSTREEIVLTFGVNQDWDLGPRPQEIQLHHRIILSPGAAGRLLDVLKKLVADHQARHGELK
jgi:Protein of unknown function (DUF3467)